MTDPDLRPLPPRLARDLERLVPGGAPPRSVDEAVRAEARRRLRPRRSWSPVLLRGAAAAAAAGLLVFLALRGGDRDPLDVDESGRVDILDAFALARRIEAGTAGARRFDLDGDGSVDQRDVDHVAARAVRVGS